MKKKHTHTQTHLTRRDDDSYLHYIYTPKAKKEKTNPVRSSTTRCVMADKKV